MEFINASVDLEKLPHINNVHLQPIHRDYLKVLRYEWLLFTVVLAITGTLIIVLNAPVRETYWWLAIIALVLLTCGLYFYIQEKSFAYKAFAVREKDVIYRKGWLHQTTTICPFNRIQNCSVQSGPWERKFNLASLIIYTAGTEGADLKIPGLLQEEAEKIRHFILDKIQSEINETDGLV
ncbi:MAG TPA: PH domain-containing protein [Flavisolibacter sp.]|nr:PH domain-containing protein [Flavisolibacter sp.]